MSFRDNDSDGTERHYFYISTEGNLEHYQFDSQRAADQKADELAISRKVLRKDVLVIKAKTTREAEIKSRRHFDAEWRKKYGK